MHFRARVRRRVYQDLLLLLICSFSSCGGRHSRRGKGRGALVGAAAGKMKRMGRLYYESLAVKMSAAQSGQRAALLKAVNRAYRGRRISLREGGRAQVFTPAALKQLSLPGLQALSAFSPRHFYGAEIDTLVPAGRKRALPISLRIDLKGDVELELSKASMPEEVSVSLAELRARYGTLDFKREGDARWGQPARYALDQTLAQLSEAERRLLRGIPFVRSPGNGKGRRAGEYVQQACDAKIYIYNRAFKIRRSTFMGSISAPKPTVAAVLVHELGHALHRLRDRRMWCRYQREIAALDARIKRYNRSANKRQGELQAIEAEKRGIKSLERALKAEGAGPVLSAYRAAVSRGRAPTRYGESSLAEAFAEAFALYRIDPAALKRVSPEAHRWFSGDGHLRALDLAGD
ncbi:MAG: hypothetical protein VYD19_05150 [Myxococcota bacterium]|nr:hypothetical protein [Myxococcota bacterium]